MAAEIGLGCAMRCVARVRILILTPLRSTEWMELISASRRGSGPGAAQHQQIIRVDTEPHSTLHPAIAAVSAPPQTIAALDRTSAAFTSRSPPGGSGLCQYAPDEFDRRGQLGGVAAAARSRQRALGVAHDRAGDAQEILVELLHLRLAPRADRRGRARAGRATALGDLEDPAHHAARALADPLPDPAQAA